MFPKRLAAELRTLGAADVDAIVARARTMIDHVTVVPECRAAVSAGLRERGVTAMHDATEGGVLGGLVEMAHACGHELAIEAPACPPETVAACRVFAIDPLWSLSEGVLLLCARPERAEDVRTAIERAGIAVTRLGKVVAGAAGVRCAGRWIVRAEADPYWPAYARAVREGWE